MTREIELGKLALGTVFSLGGVTYKTTSTYESGKLLCIPKFGGHRRTELREPLAKETKVRVESK